MTLLSVLRSTSRNADSIYSRNQSEGTSTVSLESSKATARIGRNQVSY